MKTISHQKTNRWVWSIRILVFAFLMSQSVVFAQADKTLRITPAATEGPYWKPGSPLRDTLYQQNDPGEKILVSGRVLDSVGQPIPGAKIDIWQTDSRGSYDNEGFNYRGHVLANNRGEYTFKTVKPGAYPSRTTHIHIKITTADGRKLTTQLYFPEFSDRNKNDSLYDNQLNVKWISKSQAGFDFVLK